MTGELNQGLRDQVTLRELLQDPVYKQWFKHRPRKVGLDGHWRVYVQLEPDGKWLKRDFEEWKDAYNFIAKNIKKFHDCALSNRLFPSQPPIVRSSTHPNRRRYHQPVLVLIDHVWCGYCRRPTVMRIYGRHHNIGKRLCTPVPRCTICGMREAALKRY